VFQKTLRDYRWQVFWYGVGLALLGALVVYIYPSYRAQLQSFDLPEALQALIGEADYSKPAGFLTAEFFSWGPIVVLVFAIMAGTSALGGEEANGTLDLLLAQPISRRRLVLEKMAGFAASAVAIALLVNAGWLISVPFVDFDISLPTLLAATFVMVPPVLLVGALAMWASATLSNRRTATGLVTGFVVASFFGNYLAELVDVLAPLRWLSFNHYQNTTVLTEGFNLIDAAVLLMATALFAVLAVRAFERRDIGVQTSGKSFLKLPTFSTLRGAPARRLETGAPPE
jgi:ABC-2 type transport system permease protein